MFFFPFLKFAFAPKPFGAKANFKKGKIGCVVGLTQGGSRSAPLPGAAMGNCQVSNLLVHFFSFIKSGLCLFLVAFPLRWQLLSCAAPGCYPHAKGLGAK
jgi:hypothetical protein